ncbi:AAA family ATPase [Pseudoalteromonas mariniglutinosa]|jgi:energy-coupling factor transporter ATP-binding protein EcfA2|uniref:AAA family ATPase n=1 Tax=Pseudoalteromonas mariniglutinosa TaxID=206042 RepID=UPI00384C19AA
MQLVAVYIKEFKAINDSLIPISNGFNVQRVGKSFQIEVSERFDEYYNNYQFSLLLGRNGVGKTTILEFIQGVFENYVGEGFCVFYSEGKFKVYYNTIMKPDIVGISEVEFFSSCKNFAVAVVNNIFDIANFSLSKKRRFRNVIEKTDTAIAKSGKTRSFLDNIKTQIAFFEANRGFLQSIGNPNPEYLFSLFKPSRKRFDDALKECSDESIFLLEDDLNYFYNNIEGNGKAESDLKANVDKANNVLEPGITKLRMRLSGVSSYIFSLSHYKDLQSDNDLVWHFQRFFLSDVIWGLANNLDMERNLICYIYVAFMLRSFNDLALFQVDPYEGDVYFPKGIKRDIGLVTYFYDEIRTSSTYMLDIALKIEEEKVQIINSQSGVHFSSNDPHFIKLATENFNRLDSYLSKEVKFGWSGFSSGEFAMIKLYSRLYTSIRELRRRGYNKVILLIDEVDLYLHPEWQRTFLKRTITFLESNIASNDVHLVLSTHSPIIASDFLSGDIVIINKFNSKVVAEKSEIGFGTGINGLYLNSFSLSSSIGEYSRHHLKRLFKRSQSGKVREFDLKLINEIGDKEIREKLSHQVSNNDPY